MALKLNPLTGELEDDGVPALDGAAPPLADPTSPDAPTIPQPLDASGGGGAPQPPALGPIAPTPVPTAPSPTTAAKGPAIPSAAGTTVNVGLSSKPEHETTVEKMVEGPKSLTADKELADARIKRDEAARAETQLKVKQAEVEAYKNRKEAIAAEQEAGDRAKHQAEVDRLTKENLAADKRANEQSSQDESVKNSAGVLTGAAAVISKILIAVGAIGQGFAAAGSRGAAAWKDGNPVAQIYEEQRQKEIKKALDTFNSSERARKLAKEGRDAELQRERDEVTIGAANRAKQRQLAIDSVVKEKLAGYGPEAARLGGQALEAASALDDASHDQVTGRSYNAVIKSTTRSPTGTANSKADDTQVFDPNTGAKLFDATTPQQAKEINDNGSKMAKVRADLLEYRDLMKQIPKLRDPTGTFTSGATDSLITQAENTKQRIIGQLTQMTGAGAPSGTEKADFVKSLERGRLQSEESHSDALTKLGDQFEATFKKGLPAYGFKGSTETKGSTEAKSLRDQVAARMPSAGGKASAPPTKSPGKGAVYKTSSSHGPGWVLGDQFFPDSEAR